MKNVNFGGLHIRQKAGPVDCTKGKSGRLFRSPRAHLYMQLTGPPYCAACRPGLLCSLPARQKFMLLIWKHGPAARRPSCLVLSMLCMLYWSHPYNLCSIVARFSQFHLCACFTCSSVGYTTLLFIYCLPTIITCHMWMILAYTISHLCFWYIAFCYVFYYLPSYHF